MWILQELRERQSHENLGNLTREAADVVRLLSEPIPGLTQTRPVLKQEVADQIRANHQADAEVLRSRYGVDLGLRNCGAVEMKHGGDHRPVDELLEHVDPGVVRQLSLRLARHHPGLPARVDESLGNRGISGRRAHPEFGDARDH